MFRNLFNGLRRVQVNKSKKKRLGLYSYKAKLPSGQHKKPGFITDLNRKEKLKKVDTEF